MSVPASGHSIRLKLIALPVEHGGWGLIGAPILLGLLLRPAWVGVVVGCGAMALFLSRHPARLAVSDLLRRKIYPRTRWAVGVAIFYLLIAAAFLGYAISMSHAFLLPLGAFAAFGAVQFALDLRGKGRSLVAEVCGATALSLIACEIVLAGSGEAFAAWAATVVLALHSVAAIIYASTRLKLERETNITRTPAFVSAGVAWSVILIGTFYEREQMWLICAFTIAFARVAWGLSHWRARVRAAIVGVEEVGYTLLIVGAAFLTLRS